MKIYLAGNVPKGDKEAKSNINWRKKYIEIISQNINDIEFFDPNVFYSIERDSKAVLGADSLSIKKSDLVVINGEEQLGAGTSMEFVIAKYFKKPVVTVLPKDSFHRRSNLFYNGKEITDWIHPFVGSFSDVIIENISEIKTAISKIEKQKIKGLSTIDEAIEYAKDFLKLE